MNHHGLKSLSCYFEDVLSGRKTFEIRWDEDRKFKQGDTFTFYEMVGQEHYTGRYISGVITYVTAFEQRSGFVVFGFRKTDEGVGGVKGVKADPFTDPNGVRSVTPDELDALRQSNREKVIKILTERVETLEGCLRRTDVQQLISLFAGKTHITYIDKDGPRQVTRADLDDIIKSNQDAACSVQQHASKGNCTENGRLEELQDLLKSAHRSMEAVKRVYQDEISELKAEIKEIHDTLAIVDHCQAVPTIKSLQSRLLAHEQVREFQRPHDVRAQAYFDGNKRGHCGNYLDMAMTEIQFLRDLLRDARSAIPSTHGVSTVGAKIDQILADRDVPDAV